MAGQPLAKAKRDEEIDKNRRLAEQLQAVRVGLVRDGIDPTRYDPDGAGASPPVLEAYADSLPLAVSRLASYGQSIEEIRIALGFNERQERDWAEQYVDFSVAITRVRAREEAFWHREARRAAQSGDRPSFTAITSLIQKRFTDSNAGQDAQRYIHVRQSALPPQQEDEDA